MSNQATRVKETELLLHAIHDPAFTTNILSLGVPYLINHPVLSLLASTVVRYYASNKELLTESTFSSHIEDYINMQNRKNEINHEPTLDGKQSAKIIAVGKKLFNAKPDMSNTMLDELTSYIRLQLTNNAILDEVSNTKGNLSERVQKRMDAINAIDLRDDKVEYLDVFNDIEKKKKLYDRFAKGRVPSGLKPFDIVTGGGLEKQQVGMIAGPQGLGKTAFLTNLSYYYSVVSNHNVLHISLEELENDQNLRFDRIMTNSSMHDVFDEEGHATKDFFNKVDKTYSKLKDIQVGRLIFEKHPTHTLTVEDLDARISYLENSLDLKFDVLILDYADLLNFGNGGFDSAYVSNAGEYLFEELSRLAQIHDIVIITGSQLNRGSSQAETLDMSLLQGSYKKKNVIAFGATINATPEEKKQGYVRLYLDKVRNDYGFDDQFMYLKYDKNSMKLHAENDSQIEEHKSLVSQGISTKRPRVSKENKTDSMIDVLNKSIEEGL